MTTDTITLDLRLKQALVRFFGEQYEPDITIDASMETIPAWDSLSFISLVVHLEKEFGVSFAFNETLNLRTVAGIQDALTQKKAL